MDATMPQNALEAAPGTPTPAEATSSPGGAENANEGLSTFDPLRDYRWRERGLGIASPLTWGQRREMLKLITQGKAEALPMSEQRCWRAADMRWLCAGATRVVVKPNGKRMLR